MTSQTLKTIHLFHRRINFTSRLEDINKGRCSVAHSLRIECGNTKTLEWLPELSHYNQVWLPRYGTRPLDSLTNENKTSLAQFIAPKPRLNNQTRLQKKLSDNKRKLKKAKASEAKQGHNKIEAVLTWLIDHPRDKLIKLDLKRTAKLDMSRAKQRMRAIARYIETHNQLATTPRNSNCLYVQEGVLKIPHQWQVTTEQISAQEFIDATRGFLAHHFPDYPIKAIFYHHDERKLDEVTGQYADTGAHTHYYLSGRNRHTGEYDLNHAQLKVVDAYMRKIDVAPLLDDEELATEAKEDATALRLTREQAQRFGEYFQRMLYDYLNNEWLQPKGLQAEFAPETVRKSKQRQKMNEQAKLPKHAREFNMLQMNTQIITKQVNDLEHRLKFLKRVVEDAENEAGLRLSEVLKDVYLRTYSKGNLMDRKAVEYLVKVANACEEHLSVDIKAVLRSLALELDDSELASQLEG